MSRSEHVRGFVRKREYWKSRLSRHGEVPGRATKILTHRKERRESLIQEPADGGTLTLPTDLGSIQEEVWFDTDTGELSDDDGQLAQPEDE